MNRRRSDTRNRKNKISRWIFLNGSAAAVASLSIVTRRVLGGPGNIPPSEKLNIIGIGAG